MFDITHLKKIRKQLDLTQHEFAKRAGISQSMIAKIEAGKLDPTYSYVKKIEEAITNLAKHEEKKAKDIMHEGIIYIPRNSPLQKIIELLTKHNISQAPVIENYSVLGLITESAILEQNVDSARSKKAFDIMVESPPIIADTTELSAIVSLLKFYPLVLVSSLGKLKGVITKADVLKTLSQ